MQKNPDKNYPQVIYMDLILILAETLFLDRVTVRGQGRMWSIAALQAFSYYRAHATDTVRCL